MSLLCVRLCVTLFIILDLIIVGISIRDSLVILKTWVKDPDESRFIHLYIIPNIWHFMSKV